MNLADVSGLKCNNSESSQRVVWCAAFLSFHRRGHVLVLAPTNLDIVGQKEDPAGCVSVRASRLENSESLIGPIWRVCALKNRFNLISICIQRKAILSLAATPIIFRWFFAQPHAQLQLAQLQGLVTDFDGLISHDLLGVFS